MKHTKDFEITAIVPDTYLLTSKDGHIITIEEAMANEKLFEIAPELLEVVKNTDKDMNGLSTQNRLNSNGIKYHAYIKQLIKKATS